MTEPDAADNEDEADCLKRRQRFFQEDPPQNHSHCRTEEP